ncbi:hypothetical protein [Marinobacter sp. NP-4(2019)]|uniref:hypothetical protein n=1 Tax=Marinobacter sp. NP-4(2019) TaxID=2488665 RepID=UPI0013DF7848|nr:hypothetical protein [Marinobacter sp. NP-4(2019)]
MSRFANSRNAGVGSAKTSLASGGNIRLELEIMEGMLQRWEPVARYFYRRLS